MVQGLGKEASQALTSVCPQGVRGLSIHGPGGWATVTWTPPLALLRLRCLSLSRPHSKRCI